MTKKILAIYGSTRKTSSNLNLIHAIIDLTKDKFGVSIFKGLGSDSVGDFFCENKSKPRQ